MSWLVFLNRKALGIGGIYDSQSEKAVDDFTSGIQSEVGEIRVIQL